MTWEENLALALASAAFIAKGVEYQLEARRCRQIVKTIMSETDVNGVAVEFYTYKPIVKETDPGIGLVFCAPNLDEGNFVEPAKQILEWYFDRLKIPRDGYKLGRMRKLGTEADE